MTLYRVSQKNLAVFFLFFRKECCDIGGRPMPEICNFMFRPEHSRGEPVVKEQEALFVKCSFKTSDPVVQKQRMFRHRYLLNMNQHPKETSVGCWVNNRKRIANGDTQKTAGLMGPYARKIACANHSSKRDWALITTTASRGHHSARNTWLYNIHKVTEAACIHHPWNGHLIWT